MAISKQDARDLAVSYQAYHEASQDDHCAISVWGKMLLAVQEKTGVELADNWLLKSRIARADNQLAQTAE